MDFVKGRQLTPDEVTCVMMFSLGSVTGHMHSLLDKCTYEIPTMFEDLLQQFKMEYLTRHEKAIASENLKYLQYVKKQGQILNSIKGSFFDYIPKGISHGDFAIDNILFDRDKVVAILDFDTMGNWWPLPYRDIGRVIMSYCYNNNKLDTDLADSFMEGYRMYKPILKQDVVSAIQFVWLNEINWWTTEELFLRKEMTKTKRFFDEMRWITENWYDLSTIIHKS